MSYKTALRDKIARISRYRTEETAWRYTRGNLDGVPEEPSRGWRRLDSDFLPWREGKDIWLHQVYRVPGEIGGIPVAGSRIALRSSLIGTPTTVYIDGRRVFHESSWADTRVPEVTITEKAVVGEERRICVRLEPSASRPKSGVTFRIAMDCEAVEEVIFRLETFLQEMEFCAAFPEFKGVVAAAAEDATAKITDGSPWREDLASIDVIRSCLRPLSAETKRHTVHLIGHAHIDMNWLWGMEETIDVCRRDFGTMIGVMEENPDFRFSQSQGSVYRITEEHFPELFEKVRRHVESGGWDMGTAATWTEGDLNMASGESLIRQLLHARRYMQSRFGRSPRICWEPDTFGHAATVPQLLKKFGIGLYFHMRCAPGHRAYRWEGLDGTEVLAYNHTYNGEIRADRITSICLEMRDAHGLADSMLLFGIGDHGGGPTRRDIKRMRWLDSLPTLPRLVFSTPSDFLRILERRRGELPVVRGELNPVFEGCYTTHADIKRRNRRLERLLVEAETAGAMEWLAGASEGEAVTDEGLGADWETLLFNQFHDILCGCAIRDTYVLADSDMDAARQRSENRISANLDRLSAELFPASDAPAGEAQTHPPDGDARCRIVVWNLQHFERTDVVAVPSAAVRTSGEARDFMVVDDGGLRIPSQVFDGKIWFLAAAVPGCGCRCFLLKRGEAPGGGSPAVDGSADSDDPQSVEQVLGSGDPLLPNPADHGLLRLENRCFVLDLDQRSACIQRLYDKKLGRCVIDSRGWLANSAGPYLYNTVNNLFRMDYEEPQPMSAWVLGPLLQSKYLIRGASVSLVSSGAVMDVVSVEHDLGRSRLSQRILFYRDLRRIDFETAVEWKEEADEAEGAPTLRVSFRPELDGASKAVAEIPFGSLERPPNGLEYPCQRWIDLSDQEYGFSVLNDGKYGYSVSGTTMSLTCLRTSHNPDPTADRGSHFFRYSLYPHHGDAAAADVPREAAAFNSPLRAMILPGGGLPTAGSRSWLTVTGRGVLCSAFKRSEDGRILILRIYESLGRSAEVGVKLPFRLSTVTEIDLVEEKILGRPERDGAGFIDRLTPFEIKTYRLEPS